MGSKDVKIVRYGEWAPSRYDRRGLGLPDRHDWIVAPHSITRDSGLLEQANWRAQEKRLADLGDYETHRFGHWACGWFEVVLLPPDTPVSLLATLDTSDYPILCEDTFGDLEHQAEEEAWTQGYSGGPVDALLDELEVGKDSPLREWCRNRGDVVSRVYREGDPQYTEVDDYGTVTLGPHDATRDDLARAVRAYRRNRGLSCRAI